MGIETILDAHAARLMYHTGTGATYTPAGGVPLPINVFLSVELEDQPGGHEGPAWTQIQTIEGLLDDFGREPEINDTIDVGATTYSVKRVLENDGRWVKVAVRE